MNTGRVLSEHHKKYIEDLKSQCTIQIIGTKLSDHGTWKCLAHDDPFKGLQHTETSISVSQEKMLEAQFHIEKVRINSQFILKAGIE